MYKFAKKHFFKVTYKWLLESITSRHHRCDLSDLTADYWTHRLKTKQEEEADQFPFRSVLAASLSIPFFFIH